MDGAGLTDGKLMPVNVPNHSGFKILDFKETGHDYHADAR